jgi:hypothetical protein
MWEKGKFRPKGDKKAALVALRKLRKREVKKIIMEKAGAKDKRTNPKKRMANINKKRVAKK